ncbi:RNA polymerase sigma-70 factor (ECF subfamily) [Diaminobutyricimonas aerilata]|uniref:RNA polymerase sigma factor n=1 Tax=Diaminobutyricimonas aerilata TaxID=1162967 RepID=A0A2M9CJ65_9MICO|nr:sigma-70 family RNA polymerase sigma factor [Diaminobutyricimonas aerilata]PJJ71908.1 RNA polymerase sigma-70 factor (ECF subfamily) [Diaminobutyricimonas aerilata]
MTEGRPELLKALHDEHAPALWRYVVSLTRDHALSEDVVQETLIRAWRTPRVLEEPAGARSWLFTVARNLVVDHWRSARSRHELPTDELPERVQSDQVDAALDSWAIADALLAITPEHRAVVVLAHYGGHTVADIAERLGVPPGTVKSRLHYGLRALRLALQERGVTRP